MYLTHLSPPCSLIMAFSDSVHFAILFAVVLACYGTWGYFMFGSQVRRTCTHAHASIATGRCVWLRVVCPAGVVANGQPTPGVAFLRMGLSVPVETLSTLGIIPLWYHLLLPVLLSLCLVCHQ